MRRRERHEMITAELIKTCTTLQKLRLIAKSYWWKHNLTAVGLIVRGSRFRNCIWGKFVDSMEFQSWKINFKTEVCSKSADPHLTMHWIKVIEIAKSIDELMTSRSVVVGNDFPASALNRLLDKHTHFRKRVTVEEQRAQKLPPILTRGDKLHA